MRALFLTAGWCLAATGAALADAPLHPAEGGLVLTAADAAPDFIPFGHAAADVNRIAGHYWWKPLDRGRMEECGAGPLDFTTYPNGVVLYFDYGVFAGWAMGQRAEARAVPGDLAIGITTRTLREVFGDIAITKTSLGSEFMAGTDLYGVLSGPAEDDQLLSLWSGVSCVFR